MPATSGSKAFADELRSDAPRLDVASMLLAAHVHDIDIDAELTRLDELAAAVPAPRSADELCRTVFGTFGFHGDQETYDDPDNSYLSRVLDRRQGIPISLTTLLICVGTRIGVDIEGIGAPGHYLGRTPAGEYIDAFAGGRRLAEAEVRHAIEQRVPNTRPEGFLRPQTVPQIIERTLANLVNAYGRRADTTNLLWVTELQTLLPQATLAHRHAYALALGGVGRFAAAADLLDELAASDTLRDASALRHTAKRFRARLN